MNKEKVYPSKKEIIKTLSIFSIFLLIVLYGLFSSRFKWAYAPKDTDLTPLIIQDVAVLCIWAALTLISYFILAKTNYYLINKQEVIHHKFNKDVTYRFKDVRYIDWDYTNKHHTLLFYDDKNKEIMLILDKKGVLIKEFQDRCTNVISKDEYRRKFPKSKV